MSSKTYNEGIAAYRNSEDPAEAPLNPYNPSEQPHQAAEWEEGYNDALLEDCDG